MASLIYYEVINKGGEMKYYKWFVNEDGDTYYSKKRWEMDGSWMPYVKKLEVCVSGYHVLKMDFISRFINCGPVLAEVKVRGKGKHEWDKSCYHEARVVRIIKEFTKKEIVKTAEFAAKIAKEYVDDAARAAARAAAYAAANAADAVYAAANAADAVYAAANAADAVYAAANAANAVYAAANAADAVYAAYKRISQFILDLAEEKSVRGR